MQELTRRDCLLAAVRVNNSSLFTYPGLAHRTTKLPTRLSDQTFRLGDPSKVMLVPA